ncbi:MULTISPECIES: SGNH/GDSL hydrolase family protein [unclassified Pseudoalteromonas]|uniref:SGNH/GDSL hydrolase family protein n=1 Tax=unclassified Pseudoalteromonas TaxID=194690 RepID=UPI0015F6EE12|nr:MULTISPECIES: SGNH/GDSL hydrolase family protein [unclassified Pseudoalteromonas]MBA6410414.1 SGNH/GDSL hydrolase family protein [Pseudoalteromonas sp. 5Ae-yellow]MDN3392457.1 SGNH/GDSL hydrolase family protein [Pseudoalteromonas sp. APC 3691]
MTKNILCFGDSNTWGLNPVTGKRFDENIRWTSLLNKNLGRGFNVIEAGQPNRTLVHNPPFDGVLNGVSYLKPYLDKHELDFIIIALGTNDLKKRFNLTPNLIADGLNDLINSIHIYYQQGSTLKSPKIIIASPPKIRITEQYSRIYEGADTKATKLSSAFKSVAANNKCTFIDFNTFINVTAGDGLHFESNQHLTVSAKITQLVQNSFNNS